MHLTKQELKHLIKYISKDLDDHNNDKVKKSLEQLTDLFVLREKLKAELAKEIMKKAKNS